MNNNKFLPPLVCGFGAAVLTTIPGLATASCCLFVPAASIFALVLHQKVNKAETPFKVSLAVLLGFLTGIYIALFSVTFETLLTLITHSNDFVIAFPETEKLMRDAGMGQLYEQSGPILKSMADDIIQRGFSPLYTITLFIASIVTNSIFGIIGGLLGLIFINRKRPNQEINSPE